MGKIWGESTRRNWSSDVLRVRTPVINFLLLKNPNCRKIGPNSMQNPPESKIPKIIYWLWPWFQHPDTHLWWLFSCRPWSGQVHAAQSEVRLVSEDSQSSPDLGTQHRKKQRCIGSECIQGWLVNLLRLKTDLSRGLNTLNANDGHAPSLV